MPSSGSRPPILLRSPRANCNGLPIRLQRCQRRRLGIVCSYVKPGGARRMCCPASIRSAGLLHARAVAHGTVRRAGGWAGGWEGGQAGGQAGGHLHNAVTIARRNVGVSVISRWPAVPPSALGPSRGSSTMFLNPPAESGFHFRRCLSPWQCRGPTHVWNECIRAKMASWRVAAEPAGSSMPTSGLE
jgi:hypothetical protein